GVWASDFSAIHRHSVDHQRDPGGGVDTDTFRTAPDRVVSAYQLSVTLFTASVTVSPVIRSVAVVASHDAPVYAPMRADRSVWGRDLPVPPRSQMLLRYRGLAFGGGGEAWCSPTSTSMVMAYWATRLRRPGLYRTVPEAARGTYDATYDGTGNWPFNVAYAASFGLTGFVTRMVSMSQVEQWIKVGVPIVISIAFRYGELPGEPLQASAGHLVVVRGFTRTGDVVTNDPGAATDAGTRIVFPRSILERVWQDGSHGTAYVLYPPGWATPSTEGHKLVRTMAPVTRAGWIGMRR
ncbi:MAG: C39 family peptidase, partial [Chloroflexi bacterium]|nr:C39 family peptidase [Chloroflexota bacterium]